MEINYELNPDDFIKFSKEIAPTQKKHKPLVIIYAIMYLLFIFADIIYALFSGTLKDWNPSALIMNILLRTFITFAVILVCLGIIKLITKIKAKEVLKEPENGLFCEHRIILTENELIELTDVNTSRYSWKAIGELKELENFILINVLMSSTYVIPKRYFENQKHINKFLETANYYRLNADNTFQPSHFIEYEKSLR